MGNPTLAVTGASGALGGLVAHQLARRGVEQALLVRHAPRAPQLRLAEVRESSYGELSASVRALEGVRTVFMVSTHEGPARLDEHRTFVRAAAAAGVRHIVYTSFLGAADDAEFTLARDHAATEKAITASGLSWTFLRDSFYADFVPHMVGRDGVLRGPGGQGRCAFVARSDVAAAAAAVLAYPKAHAGATYQLTGPESLSLGECAAIMAAVRRRPVAYHDETIEEAYRSRQHYGAPRWQVQAWVSTYTAIASGVLDRVTDDIAKLTGHTPRTLGQVVRQR